ncbi:MAG TPA: hypothetical protein VMW42_00330 [Desulfatiglandales bacterium]|nr:hypothetical protein [Desulfatiglandales bacterium]
MELRTKPSVMLSMIGLLTLFLGVAVACQGRFLSYRGAVAKQESRIPLLEGGPHTGFWKTQDLSMRYSYRRDQDNMELSGTMELDESLERGFTTLEYLILRVHLLDVEGRVLESKGVLTSEYRHMIKKLSFKGNLKLPQSTTAIAFSYRGRVRDGGGSGRTLEDAGDGDSWDFWIYPFLREKKGDTGPKS